MSTAAHASTRGTRKPKAGAGALARRDTALLAGIVAVAAILRFSTLGVQSFDYDELVTVWLLQMPFDEMLSLVPNTESTPPLYYILAWGWGNVFGTGETELRALSAVLGTAAVPVAYQVTHELAGRRPGFAVAALTATSPWLVWYSQQTRTYSLLVLLAALSLLLTVRAVRDPAPRRLAAWALVAALALTAHYFAAFTIVPEAVWLIAAVRPRRGAVAAIGAVAAAGTALLPLALHQRGQGHGDAMIDQSGSLLLRVAQVPKQSLVGYDAPAESLLALAAAAIALTAGALVFLRGSRRDRAAARVAAAVGLVALAIPLLLALAGSDYVVTRNVIVAWLPLAIVAGVGIGAERAGRAGVAAGCLLCALFAFVVVAVARDGSLQRDDWRGAARALGPPAADRVIVLTPSAGPEPLAAVYLPGLGRLPPEGWRVSEIDYVGIANTLRDPGGDRGLPRRLPPGAAPPGFRLTARRYGETFAVLRFSARRPVTVTPADLEGRGLQPDVPSSRFVQRAGQGDAAR